MKKKRLVLMKMMKGLNVSLAAMEEKLKPKVLKDFDEITKLFKKLQKA